MLECPSCRRHHYADVTACPFCKKAGPLGGMGKAIGAALTTFVLAACYGTVDSSDKASTHSGDTSGTTTEPSTEN